MATFVRMAFGHIAAALRGLDANSILPAAVLTRVKHRICLLLGCCLLTACSTKPTPPLSDGSYTFQLKDAELGLDHPGIDVAVSIRNGHITIENPTQTAVYPAGLMAEGELRWHAPSKQWIIAQRDSDATAAEVGGCSDGPDVVDLAAKIYWFC